MKRIILALGAVLLLGATAGSTAWAHGHARVGVFVGVPLGAPWYYPPPYYYYPYPATVVVPSAPPTYVEQGSQPQPQQQQQPSSDWYYCSSPSGYYPYVKQCPGGWQRVPSRPPQS